MQATAAQIFRDQSVAGVEGRIARLPEVFRLQGQEELAQAEERYLPEPRG
jgi:phosphoenolpyruvate phosphomutase